MLVDVAVYWLRPGRAGLPPPAQGRAECDGVEVIRLRRRLLLKLPAPSASPASPAIDRVPGSRGGPCQGGHGLPRTKLFLQPGIGRLWATLLSISETLHQNAHHHQEHKWDQGEGGQGPERARTGSAPASDRASPKALSW